VIELALLLCGAAVGAGAVYLLRKPQPMASQLVEDTPTARISTGPDIDEVFLALMSHQFRTPLTNIIGYSELLQEDAVFLEQNDFVPDLVKIRRSGEHLMVLLDDILDLARIATNQAVAEPTEVDVPELLQSLQSEVQPLLRRTLATFEVSSAEDMLTIHTDGPKLTRALSNLVRQVVALAAQGTLRLDAAQQGEFATFTLHQDALVLNKDQTEALMLDFKDLTDTTVEGSHGAGLGLVVTREFSRLLGGDLTIKPTGSGVEFALRIHASE